MSKKLLAEALELTVAERIELVQDLWDSVSEFPESVELTEELKEELRIRLEKYKADPSTSLSWKEIKSDIGL